MSSNLGNGYIGADINFINDATQEALDDKANLAGGNTFTGGVQQIQNDINLNDPTGANCRLKFDPTGSSSHNNTFEISPTYVSSLNKEGLAFSCSDKGIVLWLSETGDGRIGIKQLDPQYELDVGGDVNIAVGKNYKINGTNIPTLADLTTKADLAGGNTFTGGVQQIQNDITLNDPTGANCRLKFDPTGSSSHNNTFEISPTYVSSLSKEGLAFSCSGKGIVLWLSETGNGRIGIKQLDPQYELDVNGDINISAGKQYLIDGVPSVGISTAQANAITANSLKTGISTAQANAITANSLKTGISTAQASAITTNTNDITALNSNKANDNAVVKVTGDQDIDGVKTFEEDMKLEKDLLFTEDDSVIKFGVDSDITLTHTADVGLTTNGTFSATQYNISGTQIASSNLSNDAELVKTSGIQTINGAKTFGDKMIVNNEVNVNGVFKHTFNASTNIGIQLDNNNVNQYALNATTLNYGWRWRGEQTSGGDTDLFDIRTTKGGTSHKVFNVSNADIIRMIGSVRIDATGTNLNLVGIPEGTGVTKQTEPAGLSVGDVWRAGTESSQTLKIKSS